jgi:hypothetical protein
VNFFFKSKYKSDPKTGNKKTAMSQIKFIVGLKKRDFDILAIAQNHNARVKTTPPVIITSSINEF